MNQFVADATFLAALAFCRIGGCFIVLPGLSSARIPMQVRLLIVLSITVSLLAQIWEHLEHVQLLNLHQFVQLAAAETFIGLFIGPSVRFYLLALGFMATALGTAIGYGNLSGPGFEDTEPQAAIGTLLSMAALLILFILDFHHAVIRSLIASYDIMPVNGRFETEPILRNILATLQESFLLVLRLGSPFIAYGLIMNLMVGVLNKLTPQIPIFFISLPFIIAGGMMLLYFGAPTFLTLFVDGFFDLKVIR